MDLFVRNANTHTHFGLHTLQLNTLGISVFNYKSHPKLNTNKLIYDAVGWCCLIVFGFPHRSPNRMRLSRYESGCETAQSFVFLHSPGKNQYTRRTRISLCNLTKVNQDFHKHEVVALRRALHSRRLEDNGRPHHDLLPILLPYVSRCLASGYGYTYIARCSCSTHLFSAHPYHQYQFLLVLVVPQKGIANDLYTFIWWSMVFGMDSAVGRMPVA